MITIELPCKVGDTINELRRKYTSVGKDDPDA